MSRDVSSSERGEHDVHGAVAVITGAGSGVGRATAIALAEAGAAPVLVGRGKEALEETAGLIAASGGLALVVPADVTDAIAAQRLFRDRDVNPRAKGAPS